MPSGLCQHFVDLFPQVANQDYCDPGFDCFFKKKRKNLHSEPSKLPHKIVKHITQAWEPMGVGEGSQEDEAQPGSLIISLFIGMYSIDV